MSEGDGTTKHQFRPRVNIHSAAKDIKKTGIEPKSGSPNLDDSYPEPEARRIWKEKKPELYAISAVIIDRIALRAENIRKDFPFSLSKEIHGMAPSTTNVKNRAVTEYDNYLYNTLFLSLVSELSFLKNMQSVPPEQLTPEERQLNQTYRRFEQLINFCHRNIEPLTPKKYLHPGIGSATKMMTEVIRVIPDVYTREFPRDSLNADNLTKIMANSYPFVTRMAMMHIDDFIVAEREIVSESDVNEFGSIFDPTCFTLRTIGNGLALNLNNETLSKEKKPIPFAKRFIADTAEVGCPAMVNFGDGSAIKRIWGWSTQAANDIYQFLYSPQHETPT